MNDYEKQITELSERASNIDNKLASLAEKRKAFALDASAGDFAAIEEIAAIDADSDSCRRERETLVSAIEQLDELLTEQATQIATKDRQRREAEARQLADAATALNVEIDAALNRLLQLFERRHDIIHKLEHVPAQ